MKVAKFLAGSLLPCSILAGKAKDPSSVFARYHKKASASTPITLDDHSFSTIASTPRDYGFAVCLTALAAQFGCKACQDFDPEWSILAKTWQNAGKAEEDRMLIGTLDFLDGRQTFQSLKLETAPVILYYPPTQGPHASTSGNSSPLRYDFSSGQPTAETIQAWLARHVPSSVSTPPIRRPINYIKIATITIITLGLISLGAVAYPYILPILQSRNLWAAGSLVAILLFTSGHMFNHIRGAPYIAGDGRGGIQYFASGFQNQFGMESQIVAAMYGVLAFSTISLAVKVPRIQNKKMQQTAVFAWCGVMYGVYAFLISVFKLKNAGYPFALPPF